LLVVRINVVELLKGRDEIGHGNLVPSPSIGFKYVCDAAGITGPDGDIDEGSFETGYSDLGSGGKG